MHFTRWLTALSLILILVLAACGGDDDDGGDDTASNGDTIIEQAANNADADNADANNAGDGDTGDAESAPDDADDTSSTTNNTAAQPEEEVVIPPVVEEVFAVAYLADYDEIVFSADNSALVVLNEGTPQLQVMDAATGDVLADISPDPNWVRDIAISNDGALVSVWNLGRGSGQDGIDSGAIYDVATGEIAQAFNYPFSVSDVVFDPTGTRYAILYNDTVVIHDAATLAEQVSVTMSDSKRRLQWSADGNYIIAHSNLTFAIISATGEIVAEVEGESVEARFANVFVSPHESVFVTTGQNDDTTVFWNTETGAELMRFTPENPQSLVWDLGPGQAIVTSGGEYHVVNISAGTTELNEPDDVTTIDIDLRADELLGLGSSPRTANTDVFDFTTNTRLREFSNAFTYWFTDAGEWILVVSNGIEAYHIKYPLTEEQENMFVEEFERFEVVQFDGFFNRESFYFPETGLLYVFAGDDMLRLYQISPGA
jgi:WD40 repeat protein